MKNIAIFFIVLFVGCVTIQEYKASIADIDGQKIFYSTQEPKFTLFSSDLEYLGEIARDETESGLSYKVTAHYFNGGDFMVVVKIITLYTGMWNKYEPWQNELSPEHHGEEFLCGTGTFRPRLSKKEKALFDGRVSLKIGEPVVYKNWVNTPEHKKHGKRIIVSYYERRPDGGMNANEFASRANERVLFNLSDTPFNGTNINSINGKTKKEASNSKPVSTDNTKDAIAAGLLIIEIVHFFAWF